MHDLGLASWFGGSLMGAIGLNGAASKASQRTQRALIADVGWNRWAPFNLAAIAANLAGGALLVGGNKGRLIGQRGVGRTSMIKTGVTLAALGATAYSRRLGKRINDAGPVPANGPTDPTEDTPVEVAKAMRREKAMQWAVPALTGALVVLDARMGEQQRPAAVAAGVLRRIVPTAA